MTVFTAPSSATDRFDRGWVYLTRIHSQRHSLAWLVGGSDGCAGDPSAAVELLLTAMLSAYKRLLENPGVLAYRGTKRVSNYQTSGR